MNSMEDLTHLVLSRSNEEHYFKDNSELMHYLPALIYSGKVKAAHWYEDTHTSSCGTVRTYTMWIVVEIKDLRIRLPSWSPNEIYKWFNENDSPHLNKLDEIMIDSSFIEVSNWIRANVPKKQSNKENK